MIKKKKKSSKTYGYNPKILRIAYFIRVKGDIVWKKYSMFLTYQKIQTLENDNTKKIQNSYKEKTGNAAIACKWACMLG